jgi:putative oxidoreductase
MFSAPFKYTLACFLLRLGLAIIVLYHGAIKFLVTSGGIGWDNHLPGAVQAIVAWAEVLIGIALLFGLLTRVAAAGLAVIQVGAIMLVTGRLGFGFSGEVHSGVGQPPLDFASVGTEYNFAIIVMCVAVMLLGAGALAVDHYRGRSKQVAEAKELQLTT